MSIYSTTFAELYDNIMGDYTRLLLCVNMLLATTMKKSPQLRILELGCGTGTILREFPKTYELYGLDISPSMLEVAKKKVPHATFVEGDMTNFSLKKKFDVILCVFDSINHLTEFSQWKKVFSLAAKHLDTNGVFIFDMNTPKRLTTLTTFKPFVKRISKNTIAVEKLIQKEKNLYELHITIIENIHRNSPNVLEEIIQEVAFDPNKVTKTLKKYFKIQKSVDPFRKRVTKNTGRIFFACVKR